MKEAFLYLLGVANLETRGEFTKPVSDAVQ